MPENTTEERPPQLDNVRDNATQEDFKMKNKVWEMLEYAGPQLEEFPRAKRGLTSTTMCPCVPLHPISASSRAHKWTRPVRLG